MTGYKKYLLILALLFCSGCATLLESGPTRRISPVSAGSGLDIPDLKKSYDCYKVFYSGPKYNPSAILFIHPQGEEGLKTAPGWNKVESQGQLSYLLSKIDILKPKLWCIVPSGKEKTSPADIMAYIYTPGYATVQKRPGKNAYLIQPVPKQFNPVYYDPEFNDLW